MPGNVGVGQDSFVTVGTTPVLLVGPSENRYALVLFPSNGGRYTISSKSSVTIDNGPTIITNGGTVKLTEDEVGSWIKGQIWAVATGNQVVGFVECLMG